MPEWFYQLGLMAWPLATCSVLGIMICLERSVFVVNASRKHHATYDRLSGYLSVQTGQPKHLRDEMVGIMLNELQRPYYSGLKLLRMIGTISPMLGLLGTVLGIISAFRTIAAHTGAISPNLIADGLWEAMLTTAVGLMIALPALLAAHFFRSVAEKQLGQFCAGLNSLSLQLEMEKHGDASSALPPSADALLGKCPMGYGGGTGNHATAPHAAAPKRAG